MAREIIRVDTTAGVTLNTGDGNSMGSAANAGDNNRSTFFSVTTKDSTGAITTYTLSFKAASTKSRTWAKYRLLVYATTEETDGTSTAHSGGYAKVLFKDPTGGGVTQTGGLTTMIANGGGGSSTLDQVSSLVTGNPSITSGTTQIVSLEHRAYAGTDGSTDWITCNWFELALEGFVAPAITSINSGNPIQTGADVVVSGTDFDTAGDGGGNGLTLSSGYTAANITYDNDSTINVYGLKGPPGSCTFTVVTNGGTVNSSQQVNSSKFFRFFDP